jgi:superfamily II DNA or RNA helicase
MNKIEVFRTHVEIHDYELGDSRRLERSFSIYDKITHRFYFKALYYDKKSKTLYLPRGIDIAFLEMIFDCQARVNMDCDPYYSTGPIMLKNKPRDEVQQEAIAFMISQGKYHNNRNYTMLQLNLNTGKGKSYCSVATMSFMQYRSIVITDSISILKQWRKFITDYTDMEEKDVCIINGSPKFLNLINSNGGNYKVFLCSHSTIQSVASTYGWNKVGEFFRCVGIGIKFYDEAHLNFDNMFMIDCFTNTLLSYYITATPGRSDETENSIFKLYFKNVPSINLFDEDNDPHTEYVAIKYNSQPDMVEINRCMGRLGLNRAAYTNYVVDKENFEYILHILVHFARTHKGKCLWYVGSNEAIIKIRDWIYEHYPDLIGLVGIFTTIVSKEEKEKQLEKKIILSTTKSAGAAVDIPGLEITVVLAEPFKSKILAQQTLGRTRSNNTLYIDIVDIGFKTLNNHYKSKASVFNKYATKCSVINLSNSELKERSEKLIEAYNNLQFPMEFEDPNPITYNKD